MRSLGRADVDHRLLGAVQQAVGVLYAHDAGGQGAPQHLERHTADPDAADLALVAQGDHLGELVVEVDVLVAVGGRAGAEVHPPQIDHRDAVQAELAQVVLDGGAQLGGSLRGGQRNRLLARVTGADLADDDEVVGVGASAARMRRFTSPGP